jgi:hypothetical protein
VVVIFGAFRLPSVLCAALMRATRGGLLCSISSSRFHWRYFLAWKHAARMLPWKMARRTPRGRTTAVRGARFAVGTLFLGAWVLRAAAAWRLAFMRFAAVL